jgi:hypothetical protein
VVESTMHPVIAVLLLTLLAACGSNGIDLKQGDRYSFRQIDQPAATPRLQIIVTYSDQRSTHAALRLVHPTRGDLFWDPAGNYGVVALEDGTGWQSPLVHRNNDLIATDVPSLSAYWRYAVATEDTAMEILEWTLSENRAGEIYDILLAGARDGGTADRFRTRTTAPYCSVSLSEFFQLYGKGLATVKDSYIWPSDLADDLRTQHPHRRLVYAIDAPEGVYVQRHAPVIPDRASASETGGHEPIPVRGRTISN